MLIRQINNALEKRVNNQLKAKDLTLSQMTALVEIQKTPAKKVCSFCMWGCIIVGVSLAALFLIFMNPILSLIGASSDTWDLTKTYLSIVACSGPFVLISNCYTNIIRAEGKSSLSIRFSIHNLKPDQLMKITNALGISIFVNRSTQ